MYTYVCISTSNSQVIRIDTVKRQSSVMAHTKETNTIKAVTGKNLWQSKDRSNTDQIKPLGMISPDKPVTSAIPNMVLGEVRQARTKGVTFLTAGEGC